MKHLVFDTETGGFDAERNALLTLGLVVLDGGEVVDQLELMVNDGMVIEPRALQVNKVDVAKIKAEGLPPPDAAMKVCAFIRKHWTNEPALPIGHNVAFDVPFVRVLFRRGRMNYAAHISHRTRCTMCMAFSLIDAGMLDIPGATLDLVMRAYGIQMEGQRHGAIGDALATARIYPRMLAHIQRGALPQGAAW